jgi:hypothetical protein
MQNPTDARRFAGKDRPAFAAWLRRGKHHALRGELTDTDEPFRFKDAHDFAKMFITLREQFAAFMRRQFVGSAIATAAL